MCFSLVGLYTVMELKKPFNFLKSLPKKLNNFYTKKSRSKMIIKNKNNNNLKFDPVTNFDKSFERLIRLLISKKFPHDSIIGEEFKNKNRTNDYKWSIDPIDGTKVFVIGGPTWSNLISLSFKNKSLVGLANFPDLNKFYINDEKYSYVYKNGKKSILRSSNNSSFLSLKIIGNFHDIVNFNRQQKIIKKFGDSFRTTSYDALSYCLLAEGKIDAVIEANLKPYDILPLIPIVQNSGGFITNWKNEPAEKAGNILATSNKKLHNKLLKLLNQVIKK